MEPLFYVMAIMGCSDGTDQCAQARVVLVFFCSIQACQAAMPAALQRNSALSYPVISAACRPRGQLLTQQQGGQRHSG